MLWYGFRNYDFKKNILKIKKKNNCLAKKYGFNKKINIQINKQSLRLHKPFSWELTMTKNLITHHQSINILSPTYLIKIPLASGFNKVSFDGNTNIIKVHSLYTNNHYRLFWGVLNQVLKSFYSPTFLKLKFKGKGYYIYKNKRNTITPQFGYAHRLYLYSYFASVKFLSKTSIIIFGFQPQDLIRIGLGIKKMRPINIFTGRGVRFSRQIIYKKVGKVSSYR